MSMDKFNYTSQFKNQANAGLFALIGMEVDRQAGLRGIDVRTWKVKKAATFTGISVQIAGKTLNIGYDDIMDEAENIDRQRFISKLLTVFPPNIQRRRRFKSRMSKLRLGRPI